MEIFSFINPSLDNGKMSRNLRKRESQERERESDTHQFHLMTQNCAELGYTMYYEPMREI
jgi:hypothetical protein